ncbi:dCTP deaminase [Rhodococcus sp. 11-3]|uniref:dCTP deaminase n=1 Tax=Rhodococcus sp. 11-3 TaxID=2854796 RepID=UPI00203B4ACE|nr:dCTP deaminase [Rhodococcus sp. 11-3]USC17054.1 dCTP deaminase [Rhodococcus sp. 11-3]
MLLSDRHIREAIDRGRIQLYPFDPDLVQPSSVDVRLGSEFRALNRGHIAIDPMDLPDDLTYPVGLEVDEGFWLAPGDFALGSTLEVVKLPDYLAARFEGKSSLGRLGLMTHVTAGFIDPGFVGQVTLELANVTPMPILLRPGMKIGQLCFIQMSGPAERPYGSEGLGSKYQSQMGPTASQYDRNYR